MPRIRFALGVAPENAQRYDDEIDALLRGQATNKNVLAIGSCGLTDPASEVQVEAFRRQIAIAVDDLLCLVVQSNGAHAVALRMVRDAGMAGGKVLLRAFDGSADELEAWMAIGCYVSFDARAANDPVHYADLARLVPQDRLLVESGAPEQVVDALAGFGPRADQVAFVADALLGVCPAAQLAQNAHAFFTA